jgi:hypothetical protein
MSVRSIEAEVSIKSGASAECTIGREVIVEVHEDVNLESLTVTTNGSYEPSEGIDGYDRVTVNVPIITPEIEPLIVTENGIYTADGDGFNPVTVNVEAPKDTNVIEGEFEATEAGVLTIDTGYEGESFIRRLEIEPVSGFAKTDDGFLTSAPNYAINTLLCISYMMKAPNYEGNTGRNRLRIFSCYKNSDVYSSLQEVPYAYNAVDVPTYGTANVIKIPNNHQFKALMASAPQGIAGAFVPGIRYKYKVFY